MVRDDGYLRTEWKSYDGSTLQISVLRNTENYFSLGSDQGREVKQRIKKEEGESR